jgi:YegS/Rv2252/BmrU family lipid kinase
MSAPAVAIVNPRSAGGATERGWPALHQRLSAAVGEVEVLFTDGPNAATRLAREALARGVTLVLSVGGDGTHNEVVNGFFDDGRAVSPEAALAIIPAGTGGDLRRTFGWSASSREALERLPNTGRRRVDIGKVTYTAPDGSTAVRHFLNVASFGISGEVDSRVNASSKRLGGKVSFALASLGAFASYRDRRVRLSLDDQPLREAQITTVAVCNGQYFGGGMRVSPTALIDDGQFDLTIWSGFKMTDFIRFNRRIYDGTHVTLPGTSTARLRKLRAESDENVLLDLDGEQPGRLPATFEVVPQALWLRV